MPSQAVLHQRLTQGHAQQQPAARSTTNLASARLLPPIAEAEKFASAISLESRNLSPWDLIQMTTQQRQLGFSLVELLLVVGIIGIISAIAIPNLISSKRSANEASAISTMRLLFSAQATYRSTTGSGSYGDLGDLQTAGLIDSVVGASDTTPKSGYLFTNVEIAAVNFPAFDATAEPTASSGALATGGRSFFVNETGVLYYAVGGTAPTCTADDARTVAGGTPLR